MPRPQDHPLWNLTEQELEILAKESSSPAGVKLLEKLGGGSNYSKLDELYADEHDLNPDADPFAEVAATDPET